MAFRLITLHKSGVWLDILCLYVPFTLNDWDTEVHETYSGVVQREWRAPLCLSSY